MTEDFMMNRIIVKCECGTRLEIDKDQWWDAIYMERRMREEVVSCCCESERMW